MKHPITQFRIVGIAEAVSYLLLLGWAMPLKYIYKLPEAVRIVGAIHGGLFILYVITIFRAARFAKWTVSRMAEAFVASLLPCGPFVIDYKYRDELREERPADSTSQP